jgi:hypothetical protein
MFFKGSETWGGGDHRRQGCSEVGSSQYSYWRAKTFSSHVHIFLLRELLLVQTKDDWYQWLRSLCFISVSCNINNKNLILTGHYCFSFLLCHHCARYCYHPSTFQ